MLDALLKGRFLLDPLPQAFAKDECETGARETLTAWFRPWFLQWLLLLRQDNVKIGDKNIIGRAKARPQ